MSDYDNKYLSDTTFAQLQSEHFFDYPEKQEKKKLHWFQWVTYIIVILTCLVVLYGLFELLITVHAVQDAAERFTDGLGGNI